MTADWHPTIDQIADDEAGLTSADDSRTIAAHLPYGGPGTPYGIDLPTYAVLDAESGRVLTEVHTDAGLPMRKTNIAEFPDGLPVGWHDLNGRWYDGGRLILSSRAAIQFVDR